MNGESNDVIASIPTEALGLRAGEAIAYHRYVNVYGGQRMPLPDVSAEWEAVCPVYGSLLLIVAGSIARRIPPGEILRRERDDVWEVESLGTGDGFIVIFGVDSDGGEVDDDH